MAIELLNEGRIGIGAQVCLLCSNGIRCAGLPPLRPHTLGAEGLIH